MIDTEKFESTIRDLWDTDMSVRARAISQLRDIGPSAIPELIYEVERCYRVLRGEDGIARRKNNDKFTPADQLAELKDKIEKSLALVDPAKCPECSHVISAHKTDNDGNMCCMMPPMDPSSARGTDKTICACDWKRTSLHKAA